MDKRRLLYCLILLAACWYGWNRLHPSFQAPQTSLLSSGSYRLGQHTITALQPFEIDARVLGREDYRYDRGAQVSPTDLALGWGPMADPQILARIEISQGNRWYHWHVDEFPIERRAIETHSANMHMIPANAEVAAELAHVEPGQHITLSGQLVRVDGDDGFRWLSSLSREDVGDGACELVWLEKLIRLD